VRQEHTNGSDLLWCRQMSRGEAAFTSPPLHAPCIPLSLHHVLVFLRRSNRHSASPAARVARKQALAIMASRGGVSRRQGVARPVAVSARDSSIARTAGAIVAVVAVGLASLQYRGACGVRIASDMNIQSSGMHSIAVIGRSRSRCSPTCVAWSCSRVTSVLSAKALYVVKLSL
jgi:hypothetical protein